MNCGKITRVSGPVVDVSFPDGTLPHLYEALAVSVDGERRVMEVSEHLGGREVRCIMLSVSEGLYRGMEVIPTGSGIKVPVGENVLGRMFNVTGDPIDGGDPVPETAEQIGRAHV